MVCTACSKKIAVYHLVSLDKNELVETHLCEECYKSSGLSLAKSGSVNNSNSILDALLGKDIEEEIQEKYCQRCGTSLVEFRHSGVVGCSNCYNVFKDEIRKKYPFRENYKDSGLKTIDDLQYIKMLNDELKKALKDEQYERAAEIRDKLRKYTEQRE